MVGLFARHAVSRERTLDFRAFVAGCFFEAGQRLKKCQMVAFKIAMMSMEIMDVHVSGWLGQPGGREAGIG